MRSHKSRDPALPIYKSDENMLVVLLSACGTQQQPVIQSAAQLTSVNAQNRKVS